MRSLSSRWTFFAKFVFPVLWIALFGAGTVSLFMADEGFTEATGTAPSPMRKWLFLAIWVVGGAFLLWSFGRLKRVRMDEQALYVSNFRVERRVPLRDVVRVSENRWINIRPVTIESRWDADEPVRFIFMPTTRLQGPWRSHPVVNEVREAVRRAGGNLAA